MMRNAKVVPNVFPSVDQVRLLDVSCAQASGKLNESERSVPRPALSGRRLRLRGMSAVYLVDPAGYRRRIPNQTVVERLFHDASEPEDKANAGDIAPRPPLAASTMVLRTLFTSSTRAASAGSWARRRWPNTRLTGTGFASSGKS
jgi:hypothetical protein